MSRVVADPLKVWCVHDAYKVRDASHFCYDPTTGWAAALMSELPVVSSWPSRQYGELSASSSCMALRPAGVSIGTPEEISFSK
jgi:hypothetical protein